MSIELKIKYLTLAAEAQIIRSERQRLKSQNQRIANLKAGKAYLMGVLSEKMTRMKKHIADGKFSESVLTQVRKDFGGRTDQLQSLQFRKDSTVDEVKQGVLDQQKQINMKSMNNLHRHGVDVVQAEARSTHLARNFLKGVPYKSVESKLRENTPPPNFHNIEIMVKKYGKGDSRVLMQNLSQWIDDAAEYIKPPTAST